MADAQRSEVISDDLSHFEKFKGLTGRLLKVSKEDLSKVLRDEENAKAVKDQGVEEEKEESC